MLCVILQEQTDDLYIAAISQHTDVTHQMSRLTWYHRAIQCNHSRHRP